MRDLKFLNAFNSIPGVGPATLRTLKNNFGTYEEAWVADEGALFRAGVNPPSLRAISWKRATLHPDKEMEKLVKEDVWLIAEEDENYPALLREIPNAPVALYGRGDIRALAEETLKIAVVGTRRPTHYGLEACEKIVIGLSGAGITVVSGLATGIDARSHEAALDMQGKTIAVLGSGVDHNSIFPPENRGLARRIAESGGAVISEYAPGTPALKEHFPQRNRIISGLSKGILVVEAREKSGALITARFALEQNRDVFAVPGSIFSPTSLGPHRLIQDGAKLVTSHEDILMELGIEYTKEGKGDLSGIPEEERLLLAFLVEPVGVDYLKEKTHLDTAVIISSLSMLELKGHIRNMGGNTYQKI